MRIGTTVNVLDFGEIYDTFHPMFEKLNFNNKKFNTYPNEKDKENWKTFTKVVDNLSRPHIKVVGIQKGECQLLINVTALTKVNKTKVVRKQ